MLQGAGVALVGNQLSIGGGAGATSIGEPTAAVRSLRPSNVSMNGSLTFATLGGLRINIGAELKVQRALQWTWDDARQVGPRPWPGASCCKVGCRCLLHRQQLTWLSAAPPWTVLC
jgi:hypothetical protein